MEQTDYVKSNVYEHYICRARECDRDEFGARNQYMLNLIWKEQDGSAVGHLRHDKILADIKKNLVAATKVALERPLEKDDKEQLKSFIPMIEAANHSSVLLEICEEGLELLRKY
ncbi:MAG: hypothetical protein EOP04_01755 [Proteobacteria bacterium]|nr:MAG: hypothetical protein EOP04_01755 [Pseudomonadota bacterium]